MIRKEGNKWVLFSKDGTKRLGEFGTEEAAEERERQIQFFKAQAATRLEDAVVAQVLENEATINLLLERKKHTAAWHRCWANVKKKFPPRNAAAICTWSVQRPPNPPGVYESLREAQVTLTLDDAVEIDDVLLGEMESRDITELRIDTETWEIEEIKGERAEVQENTRELSDTWDRTLTEARINEATGNLDGIVVVEGLSANQNNYTKAALESGIQVFAGKPIFADHPTRLEERDRPERSVRDLVGKLPEDPKDLWVGTIESGPAKGKYALFYRNGILSETAGWLKTLIQEKIAGAQSINALGAGSDAPDGQFTVEAFKDAKSLDFVTSASAGGVGQLRESATMHTTDEDIARFLEGLTLADFAKLRPDIVNSIAERERSKAYGEKAQLIKEAEMNRGLVTEVQRLRESVAAVERQGKKQRANEILADVLAESHLPPGSQTRIRRLVEADLRRFVEQEEMPPAEAAIVTAPDLEPSDPPTIEVPSEVPEDKQALWVKAYLDAVEGGMEPTAAVHVAWAEILKAGEPMPEEVAAEISGEEVFTEAAFRESVKKAIQEEAQYVSAITGAGQPMGLGGANPQAILESEPEVDEEAELESWKRLDLTEAEARDAMAGRGRM